MCGNKTNELHAAPVTDTMNLSKSHVIVYALYTVSVLITQPWMVHKPFVATTTHVRIWTTVVGVQRPCAYPSTFGTSLLCKAVWVKHCMLPARFTHR